MTRTGAIVAEDQHATGDAAVDGLLAGGAVGIVMAAYLVVTVLVADAGTPSILARFGPASQGSPLIGAAIRLAVSAVCWHGSPRRRAR